MFALLENNIIICDTTKFEIPTNFPETDITELK